MMQHTWGGRVFVRVLLVVYIASLLHVIKVCEKCSIDILLLATHCVLWCSGSSMKGKH